MLDGLLQQCGIQLSSKPPPDHTDPRKRFFFREATFRKSSNLPIKLCTIFVSVFFDFHYFLGIDFRIDFSSISDGKLLHFGSHFCYTR